MNALQGFLSSTIRASRVPQSELAVATGMSEKHVSQMMTGRAMGTLTAWQALLDAAGVKLGDRA